MIRIRELRKQKKMTQKELAAHLQVADSTLSYWEMGKYEPDIKSLRELSKFFLVPIDYIVGDEKTLDINTTYTDADVPHDFSIAEPASVYATNLKQSAFNRDEFADLTHEEIDKLAEYALFIKSLR